jgi:hypothetical protein
MKLLKTKSELTELRSVSGIMDCTVKHEIKNTSASATYTGPKIPPEVWQEVLSFLKWVYDTTKSEAQVRMYVNPTQNTWKAWAYPQEARTGMSAKELDNQDASRQREQFKDSEGWIYFNTTHSHCSCGAFQSGTDEANEQNQDGLHITVGHLDKSAYDLHFRFYRSGLKFEPDMSEFWDIGEPWKTAPEQFVNKDAIARWQMGQPLKDAAFPAEWKANLIEIKPTYQSCGLGYRAYDVEDLHGYSPYVQTDYGPRYVGQPAHPAFNNEPEKKNGKKDKKGKKGKQAEETLGPVWKRVDDAVAEIEKNADSYSITDEHLSQVLGFVSGSMAVEIINKACEHHDVTVEEVAEAYLQWNPSMTEETPAADKPAHDIGGNGQ